VAITDIDHIQIAAPKGSEAEARRFFGKILGLPEIEKPEALRTRGGCWFQIGTRQLHIGIEDPFRPSTKAHPAFSVTDINAHYTALQQNGVSCSWDDTVPGTRRFYCNDPWGNRLEFTEPGPTHR